MERDSNYYSRTVYDLRREIVEIVGGMNRMSRLDKEVVCKVYHHLKWGGVEESIPCTDIYHEIDLERRKMVADQAGFEYDPGAVRPFNHEELATILDQLGRVD